MSEPRGGKPLGLLMCTALVVGNMIGSGIFLLPATLAPYGWNAIFGWVATIFGGLLLAAVFAALAGSFPRAGGPYAFAREAFGPAPAFFVAWSYWISMWVGNGAIATAGVSYLSVFFPGVASTTGLPALFAVAIVWALTAVNCRGAFLAGGVQLVTAILKVLPLIAVIALGLWLVLRPGGAEALPFEPNAISFSAVTGAATLTLWSFLGLESATVPAGKVKDAARTIPRATIIGMIITGAIYLLVCAPIILLQPAADVAASSAPFADFVARYWGDGAGRLIALFAAISAFGALNGWILLQGELPHAMAKDGVFPSFLAKTSSRGTPVRAHILSSGLLTIVIMLNYAKGMTELFEFALLLATTASLVMMLMSSLAALKLKIYGRLAAPAILAPVAALAALYALWTIAGAGREAVLWGFVLLLAGAPVYWITRRSGKA